LARLRESGLGDAIPGGLCHGLSLYPECPGLWILGDWPQKNTADPEAGIPYMKRLVAEHYESRSEATAILRLMTLARLAQAGRLKVQRDSELVELFPRYPQDVEGDEKGKAEAMIRATFGSAVAADAVRRAEGDPSVEDVEAERDRWPSYFWRQGMQISVCELGGEPAATDVGEPENTADEAPNKAAPEPREPLTFEDYLSELERATDQLGVDLRRAQERAAGQMDPYDRIRDDVLLGLASRQFRLFNYLVTDPYLWTSGRAPYFLRALVDGLIVTKWLLANDQLEYYERFRSFGLGKLKLLKEHIASRVEGREDSLADDQREYLQSIERELNAEQWEALTEVDVGPTFSGRSVFEMARDVGLDDEYDLAYQPFSSEAHGEWTSLKDADLVHCRNPLHGYHQVGRFERRRERLRPEIVEVGLGFVEETVAAVFGRYAVSVDDAFEAWRSAGAS
jgi:hypothetical protein